MVEKRDIHYSPKHGRWLNRAQISWRVLRTQGLQRRISDRETLAGEVQAWEARHHASPTPIKWRLTTPDAWVKLKRLSPSISS